MPPTTYFVGVIFAADPPPELLYSLVAIGCLLSTYALPAALPARWLLAHRSEALNALVRRVVHLMLFARHVMPPVRHSLAPANFVRSKRVVW